MNEGARKTDAVRMPPQALEAEAALLGSLLIDSEAFWRIADSLTAKDFYKAIHRTIYEAIVEMAAKRDALDVLSLSNRLRDKGVLDEIGGTAYLASLVNTVPTASNAGYYARTIHRKRIHRDLIEASHRIAELGYKEDADLDEILDDAEKTIFSIAQSSLAQEFLPVSAALEEAWQRIERLQAGEGKLRGVTSGFPDLDKILGGLQRSDLLVLASRPSLGKTSLSLDIARNVALKENLPVGYFSLEMSREQVIDRLVAAQADVGLWKLRTGQLRDDGEDNDFVRIRDAMETLSKIPLYIDDVASPTVMQIRAMARRLQAEHNNLGLVVVDYLQLIRGSDSIESRVQEVSEISRSLKALAKELNVPVLALSQLSRAIETRPGSKPKLSDLRESGCLSGDTLLMRADTGEHVPIRELVGKTDIPVFSISDDWRLEVHRVSKVFSSGRKEVYSLKLKSGRVIKASANHRFRTMSGWQRLDALNPGDRLAIPRILEPVGSSSPMSSEELILLAHLLGDGCVLPRQPIHYTSADPVNITAVRRAAGNLFKITPRLVRQKNWWHLYLPSPYRLARGRHHPISDWFTRLGIKNVRSYEKVLPSAVLSGSQSQIRLFLHHLWATDGNISRKNLAGRKPSAAIYYATASSVLATQVQHLLLRLGIHSTVRTVPQGIHRPSFQVHVQGSGPQLRFLQLVGSFGSRGNIIPELIRALEATTPNPNADIIPREVWNIYITPAKAAVGMSWRELSDRIDTAYCGSTLFHSGLSRMRMARVATALESQSLLQIAESDVYWDEVGSVTPLGVETVYDATVPGVHNFTANDIIVHNSIEQDADVVLFIYREDKVKENTTRKNIAELLIEKHRNGPTGRIELYFDQETASFRSMAKHFEDAPEAF